MLCITCAHYYCALFAFRSTTGEELGDLTRTHNPEEIDIDDDSDDEEEVEGQPKNVVN